MVEHSMIENHSPPSDTLTYTNLQPSNTRQPFNQTQNCQEHQHDNNAVAVVKTEVEPGSCAGCSTRILDRYYLLAVDRQWHANCLRCADCQLPLDSEGSCFARDGNIYCKEDYYRRFATKTCARCGLSIASSELVMRARSMVYHLNCFSCAVCAKLLTTGEHFGMRENLVYCRLHYDIPPMQDDFQNLQQHQHHQAVAPHLGFLQQHDPSSTTSPPNGGTQNFYNGVGASQKGRPRKRKSAPPVDPDASLHQLGLGGNENDMMGMGPDGYQLQSSRQKRMRTSFKHHQLRIMKSYFALNHNPDAKDLKQLAQKTGLSKRVLQVWFQNARAKYRRNLLRQDDKTTGGGSAGSGSDCGSRPDGSPDPSGGGDLSGHVHMTEEDLLADMDDSKSPGGLSDMGSSVSLSDLHGSGSLDHTDEEDKHHPHSSLTELFSSSLNSMT